MKKKLENVEVIDMAATGKAVAKIDGRVIFIDKAVPGDRVDVRITRNKKQFQEGVVTDYLALSDARTEAPCLHFGTCGGCKWQNIQYAEQLKYKEKQVRDNLERIGKVELPDIQPILPSEKTFDFRNKLEFTFSNRKWLTREQIDSGEELDRTGLGFHMPGHFDKVVDVEQCHLLDKSNAIRNRARELARELKIEFYDLLDRKGMLRTMVMRTTSTGGIMIILQVALPETKVVEELMSKLCEEIPEITSMYYVVNQKQNDDFSDQEMIHFSGEKFITETMKRPDGNGEIDFRISPKSFFQTNSQQAEHLYRLVWDLAKLGGNELVYDLYTGTGTIACYVAPGAREVIGIEYVEDAVKDAHLNADLNGFGHLHFYAGDMKDILSDELIAKHGKPDLVITDPPRAGMHKDVCTQLLRLNSRKIIYISCNPATQARDIELLSERYRVTVVQPVDMFPHTPHVENIVVLENDGE